MEEQREKELNKKVEAKLDDLYDKFDTDKDGLFSEEEFLEVCKDMLQKNGWNINDENLKK